MTDPRPVAGLALYAAALCMSAPAAAQSSATTTSTVTAPAQPAASAQTGRRAVRDPQTGEFIDGPGEAQAAPQARTLRPQQAAPSVMRAEEMNEMMLQFMQRTETRAALGAGNRRSVNLTPRHLSATVVKRAPDGTLVTQCVAGETEAEHRLHAPVVDLQGLRGARDEK